MQPYTLRRDGDAPLTFEGELVAESSGWRAGGREQNRWHEIRLYRTKGGRLVVAIGYRTQWEGELPHDVAEVTDANGVADVLRGYNPLEHVQGFPPGPAYAERQRNLECWIRQRYESQVADVLAAVPELAERAE